MQGRLNDLVVSRTENWQTKSGKETNGAHQTQCFTWTVFMGGDIEVFAMN